MQSQRFDQDVCNWDPDYPGVRRRN